MEQQTYKTVGMNYDGEIFAVEFDGNGELHKAIDNKPIFVVIRPVNEATLHYLRDDEESMEDLWKMEVENDTTRLGLREYFLDHIEENGDEEWFPGKDESWVADIIGDDDGQITREDADSAANEVANIKVATWEASGFFPPDERFARVFCDEEFIEELYNMLGV